MIYAGFIMFTGIMVLTGLVFYLEFSFLLFCLRMPLVLENFKLSICVTVRKNRAVHIGVLIALTLLIHVYGMYIH